MSIILSKIPVEIKCKIFEFLIEKSGFPFKIINICDII